MDSRMTKLNRRSIDKASRKKMYHYSPDAYWFRAEKGYAPELIAYNPLPGGLNMMV